MEIIQTNNDDAINKKTYFQKWYNNNKNKVLVNRRINIYCDICNENLQKGSLSNHHKSKKHKFYEMKKKMDDMVKQNA